LVAIVGGSSKSPQQISRHIGRNMVSYQPYDAAPAQPSPTALDMPYYGIGFIDAIKRGFRKYATFSGRASRSEYWWWALFTFIV